MMVYNLKMGSESQPVDYARCRIYSPRMVVLKNYDDQRLACVIESKKGFIVDVVKKVHPSLVLRSLPAPSLFPRDAKGRFVKRTA